jgi:hypothetical protein
MANTGVRIVHRLESGDDRRTMMEDMDADERIRGIAARLRQGEAIVRWPERDEVEVAQVQAPEGVDSSRFVSDSDVARLMTEQRESASRLMPYPLCSSDVCTSGCDGTTRRAGSELADALMPLARTTWQGDDSVLSIVRAAAQQTGRDLRTTYCSAVHLSVSGAAFDHQPGQDLRPTLQQAVERAIGAR